MPVAHNEGKATAFKLRLGIQGLIVQFKSNGYVRDKTTTMIDCAILGQTLGLTARDSEVREWLGADKNVWLDLQELFQVAIPSLEKRSIAGPDPASPEFDSPSGPLIAANYPSLIKDLDRINKLVCITKNILACGAVAQDYATKAKFDRVIFRAISLCVQVTARGYDGDSGGDEEKWQNIVNEYKKLLINCLQFLNNLIAQNETRKMMLWDQLLDTTGETPLAMLADAELAKLDEDPADASLFSKNLMREAKRLVAKDGTPPSEYIPFLLFVAKATSLFVRDFPGRTPASSPARVARIYQRKWNAMAPSDRQRWKRSYNEIFGKNGVGERFDQLLGIGPETTKHGPQTTTCKWSEEFANVVLVKDRNSSTGHAEFRRKYDTPKPDLAVAFSPGSHLTSPNLPLEHVVPPGISRDLFNGLGEATPATADDYRMTYTAADGFAILQQGKDDLMKRLDPYADRGALADKATASAALTQLAARQTQAPATPTQPQPPSPRRGECLSDEESDDDYGNPGDDGRGLLTDVPLILGPNEIEVLPMIILSVIVPPPLTSPDHGATLEETSDINSIYKVRCNFLVSYDNGRNLLRELLIFVAAWELREDELYFKFMVKIMEAILNNGLMDLSYEAFRESKDIISPAQAVIMKLLTNIFRSRLTQAQISYRSSVPDGSSPYSITPNPTAPSYPARVDAIIVNFLLTEFRRHIVPQTCALIFLQGQIRLGRVPAEDFILNLYDMDRVYEGVYQYLEFFVILTECNEWKQMMADWDMASELVTLLKELDGAIPRSLLAREMSKLPLNVAKQHEHAVNGHPSLPQDIIAAAQPEQLFAQAVQSFAVERPYNLLDPDAPPSSGPGMPESTLSLDQPTTATASAPPPMMNTGGAREDLEPSEFEWRNLKRLTVLVLSSLTWNFRKVQDQVRQHGGIEVIMSCTQHDDFNPYIREHAVACVRYLIEGNEENRKIVKDVEERRAREDVRAAGVGVKGKRAGKGATFIPDPTALKARNGNATAGTNVGQAVASAEGKKAATGGRLFDFMKEALLPTRAKGVEAREEEILRQLGDDLD